MKLTQIIAQRLEALATADLNEEAIKEASVLVDMYYKLCQVRLMEMSAPILEQFKPQMITLAPIVKTVIVEALTDDIMRKNNGAELSSRLKDWLSAGTTEEAGFQAPKVVEAFQAYVAVERAERAARARREEESDAKLNAGLSRLDTSFRTTNSH